MHIETPYAKIEALVVDDMATQQTTLRGQLGMVGVGKIDAAGSAEDALRMIKSKRYGLILCDYNLNHRTDGQQLFELLREQRLLAPDCLFFMITAESNYNSVAAASEHMPDAYLLKPITAGDIEDRLKNQLDKRQALLEINRQLNKHDLAAAVSACDTLLAKKDRWYMQALQIKGQSLLDLGCPDDAKRIFQDALTLRDGLLWAQLGLVKAAKASGKFEESKRLGQEILGSPEGAKCLAAFDLVAASMEALGDTGGALALMKQAAQVVPSAKRLRVLSESAYRNGDLVTAKASLAKALKSSQGAMTANSQDLLTMAQAQVDMGEAKEALETLNEAATRAAHTPEFDNVALAIRAQAHALQGDADKAHKEATLALAGLHHGKADFATVTVARAALQAGHVEAGLALLRQAVNADHENSRVQQLICKALVDTGHPEQVELLVKAATQGLKTRLHEAKRLLRAGELDEALVAIEGELAAYPDNTTVLLECAQMNCMSLRLKKSLDEKRVEQVRDYLARLEKLLPANDRVANMRRYLRETLGALQAKGAAIELSNSPASSLGKLGK